MAKPAPARSKSNTRTSLEVISAVRSPIRFLRRNGFTKGIVGGSNGWALVAIGLWVGRKVRKSVGKSEQVVATEKLKKGQFVRIEAIGPPTRADKKQAKQLEKSAKA